MKEYKYKSGTILRNKISNEISTVESNTNMISEHVWEIWSPKQGEWCWFYDDELNFPLDFVLDKFDRMNRFNQYVTHHGDEWFDYCKPFIGELPFE